MGGRRSGVEEDPSEILVVSVISTGRAKALRHVTQFGQA